MQQDQDHGGKKQQTFFAAIVLEAAGMNGIALKLSNIEQFPEYRRMAVNVAETAALTNLHPVFTERANTT